MELVLCFLIGYMIGTILVFAVLYPLFEKWWNKREQKKYLAEQKAALIRHGFGDKETLRRYGFDE